MSSISIRGNSSSPAWCWRPSGVVAAAAVGTWLCPVVAGPVLLLGVLVLGVAHGACDHLVFPARYPTRATNWRYWLPFLLGYLGLAGAVAVLWWRWPSAAVSGFFLLTVWHWGSADAPAHPRRAMWLTHSLLRGLLLFAVPALRWPTETLRIINGLLAFACARALPEELFTGCAAGLGLAVLAGHLLLWGTYATKGHAQRWHTDAGEVLLLAGLFFVLTPVLALGVYFVFWHSFQHVLRLNHFLGFVAHPGGRSWTTLGQQGRFFARRAWPLLLVSLGGLALLYPVVRGVLPTGEAWLSLALVVASLVTLPHALLVSVAMDGPKWWSRP